MKKLLSLALAAVLLLSALTVLAIPVSAAGEGDWMVVAPAPELQPGYEGPASSLAGYQYSADGFKTVPTEGWQYTTPFMTVQRKEMVDLKQGVYMEVRIDTFTYNADKWFNINIWDKVGISPGSNDATYGAGVQTLIRPSDSPSITLDKTKPGTVSTVDWYYAQFTRAANKVVDMKDAQNTTTEDGKPILVLTVKWDATKASYEVDINGAAAPAKIIEYMNEKWGGENSMAYIGITMQNGTKGGTAECTITKFGTTKDTATKPTGTDNVAPINNNIPTAPLADPSTVPANTPAVYLTGDTENSDTKTKPTSSFATNTINEDGSLHIIGENGGFTAASFSIKESVSYDIKDFPYLVVMIRDYCDCNDITGSGNCSAMEKANFYVPCGDEMQPAAASYIGGQYIEMDGFVDKDGVLYRYYCINAYEGRPLADTGTYPAGRINMLRFDTTNVKLDENNKKEFDLMFAGFFRSKDEAKAYVANYAELKTLSKYEPTPVTPTPKPTGAVTTKAPAPVKTEAPAVTPEAPKEEKGCGSTIASCAIIATSIVGLGIGFTRKKRKH